MHAIAITYCLTCLLGLGQGTRTAGHSRSRAHDGTRSDTLASKQFKRLQVNGVHDPAREFATLLLASIAPLQHVIASSVTQQASPAVSRRSMMKFSSMQERPKGFGRTMPEVVPTQTSGSGQKKTNSLKRRLPEVASIQYMWTVEGLDFLNELEDTRPNNTLRLFEYPRPGDFLSAKHVEVLVSSTTSLIDEGLLETEGLSAQEWLEDQEIIVKILDIMVTGAGGVGSSANGLYTKIGMLNDKPAYRQVSGENVISFKGTWKISPSLGADEWLYSSPMPDVAKSPFIKGLPFIGKFIADVICEVNCSSLTPFVGRWTTDGYTGDDAGPPPTIALVPRTGTVHQIDFGIESADDLLETIKLNLAKYQIAEGMSDLVYDVDTAKIRCQRKTRDGVSVRWQLSLHDLLRDPPTELPADWFPINASMLFYGTKEGHDYWEVVSPEFMINVHKEPFSTSEVLGEIYRGQRVWGTPIGKWVRLDDGYVLATFLSPAVPAASVRNLKMRALEKMKDLTTDAFERVVKHPFGENVPLEEQLPSEARVRRFASAASDDELEMGKLNLSIPMNSKLTAFEHLKRPGTVYKSLALRCSMEKSEEAEKKAERIIKRHLPAWYRKGNEWFGKGRVSLRNKTFHVTVTNNKDHLTQAGQQFLDEVDERVLSHNLTRFVAREEQIKAFFSPRQVKLQNIPRTNAMWAKIYELAKKSNFSGEIEVARFLLLGDILVKGSGGELWNQPFNNNDTWSPHITLLALSVEQKTLFAHLRTKDAIARFNSELYRQMRNTSGLVLLDGQDECLPLVEALLGKDGVQLMSKVDRQVSDWYSGLEEYKMLKDADSQDERNRVRRNSMQYFADKVTSSIRSQRTQEVKATRKKSTATRKKSKRRKRK